MGGSLKEGKATDDGAKFLGLVALVLLVAQNTAVVLLTKYTQLPDQKHYNSVVVVMLTELLKLVICCLLVSREPTGLWGAIRDQVLIDKRKLLLLAVPSCLYTIQNNLMYVSLANVSAALFQVTYQLKLPLGAVLTVLVFDRRLEPRQWIAIVLLFVGIACVNIPAPDRGHHAALGGAAEEELSHEPLDAGAVAMSAAEAEAEAAAEEAAEAVARHMMLVGVLATVGSAVCSAIAGVSMEVALKDKGAKVAQSMWLKNIQLAGYALIFSIGAVVQQQLAAATASASADDAAASIAAAMPERPGLLDGITPAVVGVIFLQAAGGLIIAAVLKFADNILKNFATSISTVACSVLSVVLFAFEPTTTFVLGAYLVCSATQLYSLDTKGENPGAAKRKAACVVLVLTIIATLMVVTLESQHLRGV